MIFLEGKIMDFEEENIRNYFAENSREEYSHLIWIIDESSFER